MVLLIDDSPIGDPLPHTLHVSGVSGSQAFDSDLDAGSCAKITQAVKPACEGLGLAEFDHEGV
jgi:hypothetical protein